MRSMYNVDPQVAAELLRSISDVASLPGPALEKNAGAHELDLQLRRRNLDIARRVTEHALSPSQAVLNEQRVSKCMRLSLITATAPKKRMSRCSLHRGHIQEVEGPLKTSITFWEFSVITEEDLLA